MLEIVFKAFYFLIPAYFSNMGAVASAKFLKKWNAPIIPDSIKFKNKTILGKNKTWRGLFFGILFGMSIYVLQSKIITGLEIHDYSSLTLGFLLAFGAVFGDLFESFIKRQLSIKPGEKFIPWDQIDHPSMALLLSLFIVDFSFVFFVTAVLITFVLHVIINFVSYKIGMRDTLW